MFAKQIASESKEYGFMTRIVDLQDVIENDDLGSIELARNEMKEDVDEDALLLRATLTHLHYRDAPFTSTTNNETITDDDEQQQQQRSKALFFMATYGEGEPTDNAQQFVEIMKCKSGIGNIYKFGTGGGGEVLNGGGDSSFSLNDTAASTVTSQQGGGNGGGKDTSFLSDLDYAVFGLGNKQYEHYNNMSRFMDVALEQCGASRIAPLGLGDDDDDLEGDFENWKDNVLWPSLTQKYIKGRGLDTTTSATTTKDVEGGDDKTTTSLPPCPYHVKYLDDDEKKERDMDISIDPLSLVQTSSKHYVQAVDCPVIAKRELRNPTTDPGSTLHIEIDISHRMDVMKYQTADNLGILPKNDGRVVNSVAAALNYNLDERFNLEPSNDNDDDGGGGGNETTTTMNKKHTLPFPTPCTVRECLERYCDLSGPPRRSDLKQLAPYARDDIDRKALLRMSSKEGKLEYKEKIIESHVGIADIVTTLCPSISLPLEHFIMVCPRLQPRYYTISSSSSVHPNRIHITLAVLEEKKKTKTTNDDDGDGGKHEMFKGLCSNYLAGLKIGDEVRAFVRDSTFRLKQPERPVLMFGPGTGIAPMRAILQERSHGRKAGVGHGPSILYFGCKNRNMDYIYRDELEAFQREGTLTELHLAFSREQSEKVYVQHLLAKHGEETWKLIHNEKASIFVCGAVKMGADVDHTLQGIISEQGGMSRDKAKAYLDKMAVSGRFVQELWS